ncbi:MAG: hypothetical protein R6U32_05325 [Candidatus Woesearchaeota archaeon]
MIGKMARKTVKYALVVGVTAATTLYGVHSCNEAAYSDTKPAEGFPSWERAKDIGINHVKNDEGRLETYVKDGNNRTPVYERDGKLLIGDPRECALYTLKERVECITAYEKGNGDQQGSKDPRRDKGFGFWLGQRLKEGGEALDNVVEGMKDGYKR